jgi:maltose alpha-D-glucosyltransferase/alpha-amylase
VLFTGKDFMIIDFEGEPIRPLSERRLKRSALRDVAGMVRSFHYVISTGLKQNPSVRNGDADFLVPWAQAWYRHATWSFLQGYLATVGDASFLPHREEEARILFDAFMLEKAVYELGYELNNRPDWADIPMRGILDILDNDLDM